MAVAATASPATVARPETHGMLRLCAHARTRGQTGAGGRPGEAKAKGWRAVSAWSLSDTARNRSTEGRRLARGCRQNQPLSRIGRGSWPALGGPGAGADRFRGKPRRRLAESGLAGSQVARTGVRGHAAKRTAAPSNSGTSSVSPGAACFPARARRERAECPREGRRRNRSPWPASTF